jgi:DmsE family decaheme c-type cytochrome
MKTRQTTCLKLLPLLVLLLLLLPGTLTAQEYTPKGADTCMMCHSGGMYNVKPIFKTKHGSQTDPDAPFSQRHCESCHGPSNEHVTAMMQGKIVKPMRTFGEDDNATPAEQNEACLGCHQAKANPGWTGSAHESHDVACVSCHSIHQEHDPLFEPLGQQQVCFDCHPRKRSDVLKPSGHPLRTGNMACSDCHNVHDGSNDFLLRAENVNDTCYTCHAEKRGPFLWEHAPVTEDCTLCHQPHGSNHPALLTRRPPLLCQQCHSASGHPAEPYTIEDMDDNVTSKFLLARACMNCHSQVHGSNHPSGGSRLR